MASGKWRNLLTTVFYGEEYHWPTLVWFALFQEQNYQKKTIKLSGAKPYLGSSINEIKSWFLLRAGFTACMWSLLFSLTFGKVSFYLFIICLLQNQILESIFSPQFTQARTCFHVGSKFCDYLFLFIYLLEVIICFKRAIFCL